MPITLVPGKVVPFGDFVALLDAQKAELAESDSRPAKADTKEVKGSGHPLLQFELHAEKGRIEVRKPRGGYAAFHNQYRAYEALRDSFTAELRSRTAVSVSEPCKQLMKLLTIEQVNAPGTPLHQFESVSLAHVSALRAALQVIRHIEEECGIDIQVGLRLFLHACSDRVVKQGIQLSCLMDAAVLLRKDSKISVEDAYASAKSADEAGYEKPAEKSPAVLDPDRSNCEIPAR